jgi:hypothetical protein
VTPPPVAAPRKNAVGTFFSHGHSNFFVYKSRGESNSNSFVSGFREYLNEAGKTL